MDVDIVLFLFNYNYCEKVLWFLLSFEGYSNIFFFFGCVSK